MLQRHKLTLQEYIEGNPEVTEEEIRSEAEGFPVTSKVGNLCQYTCQICKAGTTSWENCYSHIKKEHSSFKRKIVRQEWMTKRVLHECHVCKRRVDCDRRAIKAHVYYHQLSLVEYTNKFSAESDQKDKSKIETKEEGAGAGTPLESSGTTASSSDNTPNAAKSTIVEKSKTYVPRASSSRTRDTVKTEEDDVDGNDLQQLRMVGDLCEFACKFCPLTSVTWQKMCRHIQIKHQSFQERIVKSEFMSKVVWHQCQVCQKRIYCERKAIASHINRHRLTIQKYIAQYPCLREVEANAADVTSHPVTTEIGNLCEYSCILCSQVFRAWDQCYNHIKKKHKDFTGKIDRQEWMTKKVLHSCLVCGQKIDCDNKAIKSHAYYHDLSLQQYVESYSQMRGNSAVKSETVKVEQADAPLEPDAPSDDDLLTTTLVISMDDDEAEEEPKVEDPNERKSSGSKPRKEKVNDEGVKKVTTTRVGDLCMFSCTFCSFSHRVWQRLRRHVRSQHRQECLMRRDRTDGKKKVVPVLKKGDYVKSAVWHQCQVCSKSVLCERKAVAVHVSQHGLALADYIDKYPAVQEASATEESVAAGQTAVTDEACSIPVSKVFSGEVGDYCWYACQLCTYQINSWPQLLKHIKLYHR